MKEASCKALDVFFWQLSKKGLPPEVLVEGTGYSVQHLRNKNERIEWEAFLRFMRNAGRVWSNEELVEVGKAFFDSQYIRPVAVVARLLSSATDVYRWIFEKSKGVGDQMFAGVIQNRFELVGENRLALEIRFVDGKEPCPQFVYVSKGTLIAIPRMLGLPYARVEMQLLERGALYDVAVPPGGGTLGKLKKALLWPFTVRAAAEELKEAHEQLLQRYEQLEQTRKDVVQKAEQLQAINLIGRELTRHVEMKDLGHAIARLATEYFQARGSAISLDESGNRQVLFESGERIGEPVKRVALNAHGVTLGWLDLWGIELRGKESFLDDLVPWFAIALENARSFALLREYQADLERRVEERTRQLQQSLRELTEANRQRTEFFANASHELRTPLTLIVAPLEAIAADPQASEEAREQARVGLRGCYRLLKLVNDLLDIHKIESGGMRLQMGQIDLSHLLKEVARPFLPILSRRNVELAFDLPPSLPVIGDPERLEQIALNLLSNAAKFTPDHGRIGVGARPVPGAAELFVENTGEGIDPAELPRLFDRFAQSLRSRTRRFGTTGLGLPLVRELVELHGGSIEVENVPGERVLFRVRLPTTGFPSDLPAAQVLKPSDVEMRQYEVMASREGGDVVAREPSFDKPRVLLAEDNADMPAFVARCLAQEYELVEAADGEQALKLAREAAPELVLSDVMMPGLDGIELCRALKADAGTAGIPVVLLTARADLAQKLAGLDSGADDYLVKPFHPEELKARLRAQLRIRELAERVARQEKLAALGTLVAGVAHEVRNPLNAVLNSVQALKDHLPPSSRALVEICDLALGGCRRLDRITSALLRQARTGEGERTDVDVASSLSFAIQLIGHKVRAGPKVETHVPAGAALTVLGEPGALNQVWVNLLDNAIYAAGPEGRVEVRAGREGESVWVEISDSGPGIDPKHLRRIFDPFFTTKPIGQGTGLGLSLVRRLVEEHGGQVRVDSHPGEGTRFRVVLPASTMRRGEAHA